MKSKNLNISREFNVHKQLNVSVSYFITQPLKCLELILAITFRIWLFKYVTFWHGIIWQCCCEIATFINSLNLFISPTWMAQWQGKCSECMWIITEKCSERDKLPHFGTCNFKVSHKISPSWCTYLYNPHPLNVSGTCDYHGIIPQLG